jgi:hypothetical protein
MRVPARNPHRVGRERGMRPGRVLYLLLADFARTSLSDPPPSLNRNKEGRLDGVQRKFHPRLERSIPRVASSLANPSLLQSQHDERETLSRRLAMKPLTMEGAEAEARWRWGNVFLFLRGFARYSSTLRQYEVGTKRFGSVTIRGKGNSWEKAFANADNQTNKKSGAL